MQDLRSVAAGIFGGGGGGGGDRRLRPQQPLKCPRCDSLNTKFCYYNNYNLSQPRHFCKSCRRYWTKGGVLRNVPVGGGCRKPKRSSKPKHSTTTTTNNTTSTSPPHKTSAASRSSSDSSTLTAATATATAAAEVASTSSAAAAVVNYVNPAFDPSPPAMESFSQPLDIGGSFTSLITGSNPGILGFGFGDLAGNGTTTLPFQFLHHQNQHHHHDHHQQQQQQQKMEEILKGSGQDLTFMDHQAVMLQQQQQLGECRGSNGGGVLTALDWPSNNGDQGLFDLTGGVVVDDQIQGYWSHNQCQWGENDPPLYLP